MWVTTFIRSVHEIGTKEYFHGHLGSFGHFTCKKKIIYSYHLVHDGLLCRNITVSGDAMENSTGTYMITNERASKSPNNPVYKLEGTVY